MFGGTVGVFVEGSIYHLRRGEVYTIGGKKIFTFGGGTSIDKNSRIPFISWWPQENPSFTEYKYGLDNLANHNWEVDYVITHDCPSSIYDQFTFRKYENGYSQLQFFLEEIKVKLAFKKWFFGHYHKDYSFNSKFTCLYNNIKEILNDEIIYDCYTGR